MNLVMLYLGHGGALGFKGSKNQHHSRTQMASETASKSAMEHGLKLLK